MIETTESRYGSGSQLLVKDPASDGVLMLPADRAAEVAIHGHWHRRDVAPRVPDAVAETPVLPAFVNAGRWLVQCPACLGAQLTSPNDRRFFCIDCLNEHAGGAWLRVAWPGDDERVAIEAALSVRPEPHTRSWTAGQRVADLERENADHGAAA